MKLQGVTIEPPKDKIIVIPRDGVDFVFKAQSINDFTAFDKMLPKPEPRKRMIPGDGGIEELVNEPKYIEALGKWAQNRTAWTILKSLEATDGLEWDTVKMSDPETWMNYETELKTNFSDLEAIMITNKVLEACALTPTHIEEATKRFLALTEAEQKELSSRNTEPSTTQSTEPVKDLV